MFGASRRVSRAPKPARALPESAAAPPGNRSARMRMPFAEFGDGMAWCQEFC